MENQQPIIDPAQSPIASAIPVTVNIPASLVQLENTAMSTVSVLASSPAAIAIRRTMPRYLCTVTRFLARIMATLLLQCLGWTMSDQTQAALKANNLAVIIAPNNGVWDAVLLMLFRMALDSPAPIYSERQYPKFLGNILAHMGYRVMNHAWALPCFMQVSDATIAVQSIKTTRSLAFNYTTHTAEIGGVNVPMGSPNTSILNWKTMVFGMLYAYCALCINLWVCPIFFVVWMMWRNTVLTVNNTQNVQSNQLNQIASSRVAVATILQSPQETSSSPPPVASPQAFPVQTVASVVEENEDDETHEVPANILRQRSTVAPAVTSSAPVLSPPATVDVSQLE